MFCVVLPGLAWRLLNPTDPAASEITVASGVLLWFHSKRQLGPWTFGPGAVRSRMLLATFQSLGRAEVSLLIILRVKGLNLWPPSWYPGVWGPVFDIPEVVEGPYEQCVYTYVYIYICCLFYILLIRPVYMHTYIHM